MDKTVAELFAGVGGFRVGLNNIMSINDSGLAIETGPFSFVWANQWEPSTKIQPAYECYATRFGHSNCHSNDNIMKVDKSLIPNHSLLVGGFPCQDYSVARSLSREAGIKGKKGVLWWQIYDILKTKKSPFVLLENVDRLLSSPSTQRGRDFGIMLRSLSDLGYLVEWRVINAADYGFPQRRKRVFIFASYKTTKYYRALSSESASSILSDSGIFAKSFPVTLNSEKITTKDISTLEYKDLVDVTNDFTFKFSNSGFILDNKIYTSQTNPIKARGPTLGEILITPYDPSLILTKDQVKKIETAKDSKKIDRISKDGFKYVYSEGKMSTCDNLDFPGRTMLTSEGTINRSTHIISLGEKDLYRFISPEEAEKLNMFPVGWTDNVLSMSKRKRYFMMGNALVTGVVSTLGRTIEHIIENEE